jgi:hypothetical protein
MVIACLPGVLLTLAAAGAGSTHSENLPACVQQVTGSCSLTLDDSTWTVQWSGSAFPAYGTRTEILLYTTRSNLGIDGVLASLLPSAARDGDAAGLSAVVEEGGLLEVSPEDCDMDVLSRAVVNDYEMTVRFSSGDTLGVHAFQMGDNMDIAVLILEHVGSDVDRDDFENHLFGNLDEPAPGDSLLALALSTESGFESRSCLLHSVAERAVPVDEQPLRCLVLEPALEGRFTGGPVMIPIDDDSWEILGVVASSIPSADGRSIAIHQVERERTELSRYYYCRPDEAARAIKRLVEHP